MLSQRRVTFVIALLLAGPGGPHPARAGDEPDAPAARFAALKARFEADKAAATPVKDPKTGEVTRYSVKSVPKDKYLPQLLDFDRSADDATAFAAALAETPAAPAKK